MSLTEAARAAPSADNLQPFYYSWKDHQLTMHYDAERVSGRTFGPQEAATLLASGAAMENINQALQQWKTTFSWDLSSLDNPDTTALASLSLTELPQHPSDTNQSPLFKRHTNRLPYSKTPIPSQTLEQLETQTQGKATVMAINDQPTKTSISHLIRTASEIRFQTREVHEWLGQSLRFTPEDANEGDGLDVATLDLPPGGASFVKLISDWKWMARLNKIGAYKALSIMESKPIKGAPALIAIKGGPAQRDIIDAGILLERTWIALNEQGIAAHPYYVIPDQLQRSALGQIPKSMAAQGNFLTNQASQIFNLSEHTNLYMLLRIGYPKHQAIRSKRINASRFFKDLNTIS